MTHVLTFVATGLVLVFAGTALARHADAISAATKVGRLWIGSILLAGATSLPELTTDIAAVTMGAPDLAVGDLFGSSMANMLILAIVDLAMARSRVLQNATLDHALAASMAIALNGLAAVLILVRPAGAMPWVGPGSVILFGVYLAGMRAVYRHATREAGALAASSAEADAAPVPLRTAALRFAGAAAVVLAAAPAFAWAAKGIAVSSGLGDTFVGTWLVGLATSLPELVTSLAAVRMGAFDLAVGNLFGSNAFNMAIFLPLDLVQPGDLFASLDRGHAVSGLFAVVLMSLGIAALVYRAKRRFSMLEPSSLLMLVVYTLALWFLYQNTVV